MFPVLPRRLRIAAADPAIQVISLDVFDTLLLRDTEPELARFDALAKAQNLALSQAGFAAPGRERLYRARLWAHKQVCDAAARAGGEARHDDILREVCRRCDLDAAAVPTLARAEVAWESRRLAPNRPLLAWLERLPRRRLVLTSDMYLATGHVRELVSAIVPGLAAVPLYVSAEYQQTKRHGGLFAILAAAEGVAPAAILHIGDHPLADGVQAMRAGCRAVHLPRSRPWRWLHRLRDRWVRRKLKRWGWLYGGVAPEPPPGALPLDPTKGGPLGTHDQGGSRL